MSAQSPDDVSVMEFQHREIDHCRDDLRKHRRFLRQFVEDRRNIARGGTQTYLRGVHDGLAWAEAAVEGITQYDNYDALYDVREVPDDDVSRVLENMMSEARNENWGNVLAQVDSLSDALEALTAEDAEREGADA